MTDPTLKATNTALTAALLASITAVALIALALT